MAWKRFVECLAAFSHFSEDAMRINDTTNNPQLVQLAAKTLVPILKHKGHVPAVYKLGQCLEVSKKSAKKSTSGAGQGKPHKYEVQKSAYTRKDIIGMSKEFMESCNIPLERGTAEYARRSVGGKQLVSRTRT